MVESLKEGSDRNPFHQQDPSPTPSIHQTPLVADQVMLPIPQASPKTTKETTPTHSSHQSPPLQQDSSIQVQNQQ